MNHRRIRTVLASLAFALFASGAAAQAFPSKPVKIIIPFPAGGLSDVLIRGLGQELSRVWGHTVIAENRPGANTIIASEAVAKSPADGYTLYMATDAALSSNQYLYSKLPYDPVKDFTGVINLVGVPSALVASPSFPANNLQELIAMAKAKPGTITYGTFGPGSSTHIDTEAFMRITGIKMLHVPYKGIAEVIPAVLAGQIDVALSGVAPALTLLRSGKLKAIAHAGDTRSTVLPNVPTFIESGAPGFVSRAWFGLVAPAATPRTVIDKVATDVNKIVIEKAFDEKFISGVGLEPLIMRPDQFNAFLKTNREMYAERIKNVGVKLD